MNGSETTEMTKGTEAKNRHSKITSPISVIWVRFVRLAHERRNSAY